MECFKDEEWMSFMFDESQSSITEARLWESHHGGWQGNLKLFKQTLQNYGWIERLQWKGLKCKG